MMMDDDRIVTIGIAAKMLGVSDQTVRRWVSKGYIRCIVLPSRHRRFKIGDINKFKVERYANIDG